MKFSDILKSVALLVFLACWALLSPVREFVASMDPERIEIFLGEAGHFAPGLFVSLMAISVVVSPIPSLPLDVAAGAFFGPFLGTLYAVTGALLGALLSFLIARFLGRGLVERVLKGHISFCTQCSDKLLTRVVFVSRLIPFVSFDVVSYGAGLTKMSIRRFAVATGLGMIPLTLLFTYFGSVFRVGPIVTVPLGVAFVLLFFLFPRWIEKYDLLGLRPYFRHPDRPPRSDTGPIR
jgi:uncharacterized membrane protein YdjX (TVP38/TMEM64 family)